MVATGPANCSKLQQATLGQSIDSGGRESAAIDIYGGVVHNSRYEYI